MSAPTESLAAAAVTSRQGGGSSGTSFSVVAVEDWAELEQYLPAWEDLAAAALEPNVFYEAWMLRPALRAYGEGQRLTVLLVFGGASPQSRGKPLLCGLFPLERQSRLKGCIQVLRCWQYVHCFLGVPLVRAG